MWHVLLWNIPGNRSCKMFELRLAIFYFSWRQEIFKPSYLSRENFYSENFSVIVPNLCETTAIQSHKLPLCFTSWHLPHCFFSVMVVTCWYPCYYIGRVPTGQGKLGKIWEFVWSGKMILDHANCRLMWFFCLQVLKSRLWGCLGGFDPRPTAKLNLELT